jgi:hypothetical protein
MAFGHAWTREHGHLWWVGGVTLLSGILLVLSGLYARRYIPDALTDVSADETEADSPTPHGLRSVTLNEPLVPLLGAVLVYKLQYITHHQLKAALEEQLQGGKQRRLGEILVAKGLISPQQLQEALDHQASYVPHGDEGQEGATAPAGAGSGASDEA